MMSHDQILRRRQAVKRYVRLHPERVKAYKRKRRATAHFRALIVTQQRDWRFGKGASKHYQEQLKKQKGKCALCLNHSLNRSLSQDHDHSCCPYQPKKRKRTKCCGDCLRGLLCSLCNMKLGVIETLILDNPKITIKDPWLRRAQRYLFFWKRILC